MKGTAYILQSALILLWWIGMLLNNEFYSAFQFPNITPSAFNSFLLPDIIVISILSAIRGYSQNHKLSYIILGGFGYATLYCVNASFLTHGGYLSTLIMSLGLAYNLFLVFEKQTFRTSSSSNVWINATKTIIQIISVWTITLIVIPTLIIHSFGEEVIVNKQFKIIALTIFGLFSLLGLSSAYIMVKLGQGTPLPLDQTQKLVTKGPYRYVRNPMAIAGVGQGIAVSILYTSLPVLLYIILGAVLWQFVVRPIEEKDMIDRFGNEYKNYQKAVRCWIPKFS